MKFLPIVLAASLLSGCSYFQSYLPCEKPEKSKTEVVRKASTPKKNVAKKSRKASKKIAAKKKKKKNAKVISSRKQHSKKRHAH